jgi:hypothetical protein
VKIVTLSGNSRIAEDHVSKVCFHKCSGPWTPGSRCRLSKVHNWFGETPGVGNLELGGNGEGEVSLRATWDQGGRDRFTPKEGFQVIKKGWKGKVTRYQQGE